MTLRSICGGPFALKEMLEATESKGVKAPLLLLELRLLLHLKHTGFGGKNPPRNVNLF